MIRSLRLFSMKYLYREIVHVSTYVQYKNGNLTHASREGTNNTRCTHGKLDISSWIHGEEKPIVSMYTDLPQVLLCKQSRQSTPQIACRGNFFFEGSYRSRIDRDGGREIEYIIGIISMQMKLDISLWSSVCKWAIRIIASNQYKSLIL